jgi:predicted kinase
MVGLPGAGKTTRAREIEAERGALRLTPDEWIEPLYGSNLSQEVLDGARDPVEAVQWSMAARALELRVDVVLDFGFWSREEREVFRTRAAMLGAASEICFCDVPFEELLERLQQRNAERPADTFIVTAEQLRSWAAVFEPPNADELAVRD